jgi:hypothetical protein
MEFCKLSERRKIPHKTRGKERAKKCNTHTHAETHRDRKRKISLERFSSRTALFFYSVVLERKEREKEREASPRERQREPSRISSNALLI